MRAATRAYDNFPSSDSKIAMRSSQQLVKTAIKDHRSQRWEQLLVELTPDHQAYWRLARTLKSDAVVDFPALSRPDQSQAFEDADKAECLADSLESQSSTPLYF